MKLTSVLVVTALGAIVCAAQNQNPTSIPNGLPSWAYNIPDKVQPPAEELKGMIRAPGSQKELEAAKVLNNANPPDWFPDEHGPVPGIVGGGGGRTAAACGSCHLMSGQGHPESADIAGMPAEYLIRQMLYFKTGARKDDARMGPIAKATSDEDVREAAEYYASIRPRAFVKVIETANPPRTYINAAGRHHIPYPDGSTEPIGHRIIQTPEDAYRMSIRDPHSGFIAYVPPGSIAKGEELVSGKVAAKTIACNICHGDGLHGLGEVPRLAGLQPVYIARQLITMQNGSSAGKEAALMKRVVGNLSEDDVIAISAYLGSLKPE